MPGPRVHEDLSLRVRAHARHFADMDIGRRLQQIGVRVEWNLRDGGLTREHASEREHRGHRKRRDRARASSRLFPRGRLRRPRRRAGSSASASC